MTGRRRLDLQAASALCNDPNWWRSESWRRFLARYEAELGGDRLYDVAVEDAAALVGRMTWRLMLERQYGAAEAELKRLFAHPDAGQLELAWEFRCRLAFCTLGRGDESEALSAFRSILAEAGPGDARRAACFIRNHLGTRLWRIQGLGPAWPRRGLASEGMTGFVQELSAVIRGEKPRKKRFPPRTSYAKLRRCLLNTYPPDRYAHVDLEGCDAAEAARLLCEETLRQVRAEQQ